MISNLIRNHFLIKAEQKTEVTGMLSTAWSTNQSHYLVTEVDFRQYTGINTVLTNNSTKCSNFHDAWLLMY